MKTPKAFRIVSIIYFIYLIFFCKAFLQTSFAQPNLLWAKTFDFANHQDVPNVLMVDDSGYIFVAGQTEISNNPQTNFDAIILKYDSLGNLLWERRHSLATSGNDEFIAMAKADSGKVLVSGNMQVGAQIKILTIMYNTNGDTLWIKDAPFPGYMNEDMRRIIYDNNYFIIVDYIFSGNYTKLMILNYDEEGYTEEINYTGQLIGIGPRDIQISKNDSLNILASYDKEIAPNLHVPAVIKFDINGAMLWDTALFDSSSSLLSSKIMVDNNQNVYSLSNGDIYGNTIVYLTKLDVNGDIIWQKVYEVSTDEEIRPTKLLQKTDGTIYIIGAYLRWTGTENRYGLFFLKYNEDGELLKSKIKIFNNPIYNIVNAKVDEKSNMYILSVPVDTTSFLPDYEVIKYDDFDNFEYDVIYSNLQNGSSLEEAKDFHILREDNFIITGRSAYYSSAYDILTVRYSDNITFVEQTNLPIKFSLEQNYPNPFNPSTKIKFTIPQSPLLGGDGRYGLVTLKVYDVLGNEVATLVNEQKPAGTYEVIFNAGSLSSGIYFYKLQAGNFMQVKKMILLK